MVVFREHMDTFPTLPKATDAETELVAGLLREKSGYLIDQGAAVNLAYSVLTAWRSGVLRHIEEAHRSGYRLKGMESIGGDGEQGDEQ